MNPKQEMYIGQSVYKNFGTAIGFHLGRVANYCTQLECYAIHYDDGDSEDLTHLEMTRILISADMRKKIEGKESESMDEKGAKGTARVVNNPVGMCSFLLLHVLPL